EERGWAGITEVARFDEPLKVALAPGVTVKGVVAAEGGAGIPAARVAVLAHVSGMVSNVRMETLCDADGAFSIPAVPPADGAVTHRLCVDASGYGPKSYVDIEVSNQAGATTDLGKISLPVANASLGGVVVDANDRPVAGVPIFLNTASRDVGQPPKTAATDENGRFQFTRICAGLVHLQANFSENPQGWGNMKAEAGRQDVRIVLRPARQSTGRSPFAENPRQHASLKGKRLEQVKGLESLPPPDAGGKPLLIVFMDQQQRPSRAMVQGLAGRLDSLKDKGIEVVAVQVASMDRASLDQWLVDQKAPFKAQMLETAFEKQRYAWGVKAIPWLILTDRNHNVTAEGFGLDELGGQIEAIESKTK
ncbi:MAG: carboxypeptidase-like regulatory domain-containing protein, partial [Phycisphaerales bacterium]